MRCWACNLDLADLTPVDRPTGRVYCTECFSFTLDIQLAAKFSGSESPWIPFIENSNMVLENVIDINPDEDVDHLSEVIENSEEDV